MENNFGISLGNNLGLYPDYMHITHLALAVDALSSVILDLCDLQGMIAGDTLDKRLETLWDNYRGWCEAGRVSSTIQNMLWCACLQRMCQLQASVLAMCSLTWTDL